MFPNVHFGWAGTLQHSLLLAQLSFQTLSACFLLNLLPQPLPVQVKVRRTYWKRPRGIFKCRILEFFLQELPFQEHLYFFLLCSEKKKKKTKLPQTKLMSSFGLHQYPHLENVKEKHIINIGVFFFFFKKRQHSSLVAVKHKNNCIMYLSNSAVVCSEIVDIKFSTVAKLKTHHD